MKTAAIVLAICLVGVLCASGTYWRAERVRSAYRVRALAERLAHAQNENAWLRGEVERKLNPTRLQEAAKRCGLGDLKPVPVVTVPERPVIEVPGL
jgi:hypothetical protein